MPKDEWHEVSAVHERFNGVSLEVWLQARRALRARSASRKSWDERAVFKALDDIEAMVEKKSVAHGLIDRSLSDNDLRRFEQSLFSGFKVSDAPQLRLIEGGGREIAPREPEPYLLPRGKSRRRAAATDDAMTSSEALPDEDGEAPREVPELPARKRTPPSQKNPRKWVFRTPGEAE